MQACKDDKPNIWQKSQKKNAKNARFIQFCSELQGNDSVVMEKSFVDDF